jgi:predicted 3-demethylubiquinone-9 3-methyltransferase (glyoxalase superfamily)
MRRVTPCLWFNGQAEEAARFYVSLLPDSRIDCVTRSPSDTPSGPPEWCSRSSSRCPAIALSV